MSGKHVLVSKSNINIIKTLQQHIKIMSRCSVIVSDDILPVDFNITAH